MVFNFSQVISFEIFVILLVMFEYSCFILRSLYLSMLNFFYLIFVIKIPKQSWQHCTFAKSDSSISLKFLLTLNQEVT